MRGLARSPLMAVLAVSFFAGGIILSLRAQPDLLSSANSCFLVFLIPLNLLSILLGAFETRQIARTLGTRISIVEGGRLTVLGSVANMLPVPGAMIVRVAGFRAAGIPLRAATEATVLAGIIWLGLSLVAAGAYLVTPAPVWGLAFLYSGPVLILLGGSGLARSGAHPLEIVRLLFIRALMIIVAALSLGLSLAAIGEGASIGTSLVLASSGPIASAVGLAPGGFGLREGVAAALAAAMSLPASAGFLAASLCRIAEMLVLLIASPIVFKKRSTPSLADSVSGSI